MSMAAIPAPQALRRGWRGREAFTGGMALTWITGARRRGDKIRRSARQHVIDPARIVKSINLRLGTLLLAAVLAVSPAAQACGYHDPSSVNLGMLNLAYPDALHVRTAVWMAQLEGLISRDEQPVASDPQTAMIRAMFRLRETGVRLGWFRDRIGAALDGRPVPAFSMVLIGPMLWARFEQAGATLELAAHATGPASADVVIVTDEPVLAALLDGRLTPREARKLGLIRFYGVEESVADVGSLLDRLTPLGASRMSQHHQVVEAN
jgi:hypothetical protein